MFIEFDSKFARVKEEIISDVIAFGSEQLFPHEDDVYINIQAIRRTGVCGDCMYEDDNEFTIRLNKSLSLSELVTTVLHELVHVKQYLEGMEMNSDLDYWDRPHEIEAHSKEKELTEAYNAR